MGSRDCILIHERMFGEYVYVRKFTDIVKEMIPNASLYNMFVIRK
jgi:hypothetical protein